MLSNRRPRSHGDLSRFEALFKPRRMARLRLLCVRIAVMSWQVRAMKPWYSCGVEAVRTPGPPSGRPTDAQGSTDRTKRERISRGPASGGRPLRFH